MKMLFRILVVGSIGIHSELGSSQSSFYFDNRASGLDAPVFDGSGNRLFGANFLAMLYGGASPEAVSQAVGQLNSSLAPAPFTYIVNGQGGYFAGQVAVIPSVPCAGFAWLQVRAWDARLGASYEDVVRLGLGGYGESNLFQAQGGNACPILPDVPRVLIGLQSFSLLAEVPEPNSLVLLLLGLPLLLLRRRGRE